MEKTRMVEEAHEMNVELILDGTRVSSEWRGEDLVLVTTVRATAPFSGPTLSEDFRDWLMQNELSIDLITDRLADVVFEEQKVTLFRKLIKRF